MVPFEATVRSEPWSEGKLMYALFDFDISIMAPPGANGSIDFLTICHGGVRATNPWDTAQGEFDYDPFAFDVGMLGSEFCQGILTPHESNH